eukprot:303662-Chlamydomonas_euryale.AAC.6
MPILQEASYRRHHIGGILPDSRLVLFPATSGNAHSQAGQNFDAGERYESQQSRGGVSIRPAANRTPARCATRHRAVAAPTSGRGEREKAQEREALGVRACGMPRRCSALGHPPLPASEGVPHTDWWLSPSVPPHGLARASRDKA